MKCPNCGSESTIIAKSKPLVKPDFVKRRRTCQDCGHDFLTFEVREEDFQKLAYSVPSSSEETAKATKQEGALSPDIIKLIAGMKKAVDAVAASDEVAAYLEEHTSTKRSSKSKPSKKRKDYPTDADFEKLEDDDIRGWATLLWKMGE